MYYQVDNQFHFHLIEYSNYQKQTQIVLMHLCFLELLLLSQSYKEMIHLQEDFHLYYHYQNM